MADKNPKQNSPIEQKKRFDWGEFLKPTSEKIFLTIFQLIACIFLVFSILILRGSISAIGGGEVCTYGWVGSAAQGFLNIAFGLFIALGVVLFGGGLVASSIVRIVANDFALLLLIGFGTQALYSYFISCLICWKWDVFTKILLFLGVVFVLCLLMGPIISADKQECHPGGLATAQCKAQIARALSCYGLDGFWNSSGCGESGCTYLDVGVMPQCSVTFKGSSWYKDETHFNCGPQPG